MFPGNLLQHNYADPDNSDRLVGRSEVERRGEYFDQLEDLLPGGRKHAFIQLAKNCLQNAPSQRPTAEQLVTALEEMKADIEGPYGDLAKVDAVRQVKTVKALKQSKKETVNELTAKDEEIQQLQQQLEVNVILPHTVISVNHHQECHHTSYPLQAANERLEAALHQKEDEMNVNGLQDLVRKKHHNCFLQLSQAEIARIQETYQAELQQRDLVILQKTAELEQRTSTVQQQLREKDEELQQKETQLQQRNADISRLRRELQVCMYQSITSIVESHHHAWLHISIEKGRVGGVVTSSYNYM